MRSVACLALATLLLAAPSPAAAGGPPGVTPHREPADTRVERYGVKVFAADLAWLGAMALLGQAGDDEGGGGGPAGVFALGYFVAGPAMHAAQGNPQGAWKSLGARTLMPIGGAVIGMAIAASGDDGDDDGTNFAVLGGMVLGGAAGMITALIVDYTVFAKKTVEVPHHRYLGKTNLRPGVKISRQSFAVSVGGSF